MNRRRFLQALFAVPCLGAPLLVPTVVPEVKTWTSGWMQVPAPSVTVFVGHNWTFQGGAVATFTWPALLGEGG